MKAKLIYLIGFIVMVILQIVLPSQMIFQSETALNKGKVFKFQTVPVDPNDPFRGKYMTLRYAANSISVDHMDGYEKGLKVYVMLEEDMDGWASVKDIRYDRPTEITDFTEAIISHARRDDEGIQHVRFEYPFDRYYLNEKIVEEVEGAYREAIQQGSQNTYAIVRIHSGRSVIEDIMIDGISITSYTEKK
jgi:uncharacterized membrane-anchored protein